MSFIYVSCPDCRQPYHPLLSGDRCAQCATRRIMRWRSVGIAVAFGAILLTLGVGVFVIWYHQFYYDGWLPRSGCLWPCVDWVRVMFIKLGMVPR